jgi:hypothetical protein
MHTKFLSVSPWSDLLEDCHKEVEGLYRNGSCGYNDMSCIELAQDHVL